MPAEPKHTACRSCGARIIWCETITQKRMPVDASPTEDGNILLGVRHEDVPLALVQTEHNRKILKERGQMLYVSHFATCPQATAHRKGSKHA